MGYAVAVVDYRLSPADITALDPDRIRHPDHVRDVALGTRFLVDHAEEFLIDSSRRAIVGHSTGAGMAAILATNPTFMSEVGLSTSDWDAAVLIDGGIYRLDSIEPNVPNRIWRGRSAIPQITVSSYGVVRSKTPPTAGARPVGYDLNNGEPYYDYSDRAELLNTDSPLLYPALLSGPEEPPVFAPPHALNASAYHNILHGDPSPPTLLVYGITSGRKEGALEYASALEAIGQRVETLDTPYDHGELLGAMTYSTAQAAAYRTAIDYWMNSLLSRHSVGVETRPCG